MANTKQIMPVQVIIVFFKLCSYFGEEMLHPEIINIVLKLSQLDTEPTEDTGVSQAVSLSGAYR